MVGITFLDSTRDPIAHKDSVLRVETFNDKSGGAQRVVQGAIAHGHGYTSTDCSSNSPTIIIYHNVLHCPVAQVGERLKISIQHGRKWLLNWWVNWALVE